MQDHPMLFHVSDTNISQSLFLSLSLTALLSSRLSSVVGMVESTTALLVKPLLLFRALLRDVLQI